MSELVGRLYRLASLTYSGGDYFDIVRFAIPALDHDRERHSRDFEFNRAETIRQRSNIQIYLLASFISTQGARNFPITPQLSAQPTQIQRDLTTKNQAVNIRKNLQKISTNFRPWTSFGAEFVVSVFLALHRS
jgi:hypothetical protein